MTNLPEVSIDEQQHSAALINTIHDQLPMSFRDYMQRALYDPHYGYYSSGMHKFGQAGDFVTAPEISTLFGKTLANYYLKTVDKLGRSSILEFGAGTGKLALDILTALKAKSTLPDNYYILEVSADLAQRQQQLLNDKLPEYYDKIIWLRQLPESFNGLVIANEVLDAMPVHKFQLDEKSNLQEFYVDCKNNKLTWCLEKFHDEKLVEKIKQLNIQVEHSVYESEINTMIKPWLQSLADIMQQGQVLLIDYGYPQHEYYHPDRYMGTLMCHYKHRAHSDPLILTGLQDITAHVDFTEVMNAAKETGFTIEHYSNQARFLIDHGIAQLAEQQIDHNDLTRTLKISQQLQTLTMPHEMGELFKVLVLSK